jgi:dTDP-4-amino-4,6-dideoxygalactose transaminase
VDAIQELIDHASRRSRPIAVLYDAAHALGSSLGNRRVGSFGNAEVFSLSATKLLVSIEGGMVTSLDSELIERIRTMRNYGLENYDAVSPGLNAKMSELHAIVGMHNIRRLPELVSGRRRLAEYYTRLIEEETSFRPVAPPENAETTYKDFTVLVPPALKAARPAIMAALAERGIETRAYFFPAVHEQRYFRRYADRSLPATEDLSRRVITLPFFTQMSRGEVDRVVQALKEAERVAGA